MKRLLEILVIVLLMLSVAAMVFGAMLFRKRELLKGRTHQLEQAVMKIASTLECERPGVEDPPDYPERDVDSVTSEIIEDPEESTFWERYVHELEMLDLARMDLRSKRRQLMTYYRIDPITLRIARDPLTGQKVIEGPGTMNELLRDVIENAANQLDRLNNTREQLQMTRIELVDSVTEVNTRRRELRGAFSTIEESDRSVARLEVDLQARDDEIEIRDDLIVELRDTVRDQELALCVKEEDIQGYSNDVVELARKLEVFLIGRPETSLAISPILTRGVKGEIAAVNAEWNFVVVNLTEDFLRQYQALKDDGWENPDPALTVFRDTEEETIFITKVRIDYVYPDKRLGVATILSDWQQGSVNEGDRVLY